MLRVRPHPLLLVVAVYVVLRGLMLLTNFDRHAIPVYELAPAGIVAELFSGGWRGAPLTAYYDNCGGHLIVGLMAAPVYALFGSSYLALTGVPLLRGGVDRVLVWDLARRLFGRRAAWISSLAFALGPQTLLIYSVLAKGNHFEGLTLQLFTAWLWVRGFQSEAPRRWWLAAAFTAGFSIFFYFGSLLWVPLLLVTHVLVRGPRRGGADVAMGLVPFALGLAPVVWMELKTGRPSRLLWTYLREFRPWERIELVLTDVLPRSAGFAGTEGLPGEVADRVFLLLFVFVWAAMALVVLRGERLEEGASRQGLGRYGLIPFLGYLPLFLLAFALTTPRFDSYPGPIAVGEFRYLVPHFAFSCVLLGAFAEWARREGRPWGLPLSLLPIILGAVFAVPRVNWSWGHFGEGARYPGHDYADVARVTLRHSHRDEASWRMHWHAEEIRAELACFTPAQQKRIAVGLGREMARAQAFERGLAARGGLSVERILRPLPEGLRDEACRGIGAAMVEFAIFRNSMTGVLRELEGTAPELAQLVVEGMTSELDGALTTTTPRSIYRSRELAPQLPPSLFLPWLRGQGIFCGELLARGMPNDAHNVRVLVDRLRPEELEPFWAGAEEGWNRAPTRRGRAFPEAREAVERTLQEALEARARLETRAAP